MMSNNAIPAEWIVADALVDLRHPDNSEVTAVAAADHILGCLQRAGYSVVLSAPLYHVLDEVELAIAYGRDHQPCHKDPVT